MTVLVGAEINKGFYTSYEKKSVYVMLRPNMLHRYLLESISCR